MTSALLGVNIDHVATLRQARGTPYPDLLAALQAAERGGADGITIHLREDRRHIQVRDVEQIQQRLQTRLNLEMAVTDEMLWFADNFRPAHCCLVPEKRQELTTEGGLDVLSHEYEIRDACERLKASGIEVSLFIDPDHRQIEAAFRSGAPVIEIHTGAYAEAPTPEKAQQEKQRIEEAVAYARQENLLVNAGHGLNYHNVQEIAAIPAIHELNIGHSIVAQALFTGLEQAVRDMKLLIQEARQ